MLQTFIWPFVRITALMITAPIFSQRALNLRVRIVIGFVLTWMIYPFIHIPQIDPFSVWALYGLFNEITVGAIMGFTLQIVSAAIVVSGHAVSSSMGLGHGQHGGSQFGQRADIVTISADHRPTGFFEPWRTFSVD